MTIVKWMKPAYQGLYDPFVFNGRTMGGGCNCTPSANISETAENYTVELVVPGMEKEDFNISLEKDVLSISSERENKTDESITYTRREFVAGPFNRSFIVPKTVDTEKITAEYVNGVLRLMLPKKEEARIALSRQISVN